MRRILVVNGPNLNMLGIRKPDVYGSTTLRDLERMCRRWGAELGFAVETYQSNHEGEIIDRIHAERTAAVGIVINPGALTHYSYAIHDALEAIDLPTVEVHISNVKTRELWRRHSVIAPACLGSIYGRDLDGYRWAMRHLAALAAFPAAEVRYGAEPDQVGDLRVPQGPGPHPVVVTIHGGFWADPWQRDTMGLAAASLALDGYAVWNPEYRRVGSGGGWPATPGDVTAAVDHLAQLGAEHDLDLDRVTLLGHSAGGHLALWAAGNEGAATRVRPARVVALAPVADLVEGHHMGLGDGAVESFLEAVPGHDPDRYREASPRSRLPLGVPQILIHGAADDRVPAAMSRAYVAAALDAGDDARLVELADVDHFTLIDPWSKAWPAVQAALTGSAFETG